MRTIEISKQNIEKYEMRDKTKSKKDQPFLKSALYFVRLGQICWENWLHHLLKIIVLPFNVLLLLSAHLMRWVRQGVDLDLFTTQFSEKVLLKYRSEEKGSSLCKCSSFLGFLMSKNQERFHSDLLSEHKITNLLGFLT